MAFIGVRISWLILARKSDLARLARRASAMASCRNGSGLRPSFPAYSDNCSVLVARLQTVEHAVETLSQAADFVLAPEIGPLIQACVARNPVVRWSAARAGDRTADFTNAGEIRDEQCAEQEGSVLRTASCMGMVLLERRTACRSSPPASPVR